MSNLRIGFGFDVHQLAAGYEFWLGGIQLEHPVGSKGHSDADVLIHAICDAVLGAINSGDIGAHFPDTDPKYKGVDSKLLLAEVMILMRKEGYEVVNIDSTVCLELPKLRPHIEEMKAVMSQVMGIEKSRLSVKATTTEKMSFVGRGEGISAYAQVLVEKVR